MASDSEGCVLKQMGMEITELKQMVHLVTEQAAPGRQVVTLFLHLSLQVQSGKQELSRLREQLMEEEIEQLRPANASLLLSSLLSSLLLSSPLVSSPLVSSLLLFLHLKNLFSDSPEIQCYMYNLNTHPPYSNITPLHF